MFLFWNVRYVDRLAREFKDRELCLDTETLEPALRMAVELTAEKQRPFGRDMLKYRALFRARDEDMTFPDHQTLISCGVGDYFEEEDGIEISLTQAAEIITGEPVPFLVPSGTKQYEIEYRLNAHIPIPCDEIDLTDEAVRLFAYFSRDMEELISTVFYSEGPGSFRFPVKNRDIIHTTSVSGDEIRAHLMVFRRLYMAKEPANILKASVAFQLALSGNPISSLVNGRINEYEVELASVPNVPHSDLIPVQFQAKRLIDAVMYTKYLHQPNSDREQQFFECLQQVGGRENYLNWLFLSQLHSLSMRMRNAGLVISSWFGDWCKHRNVSPNVVSTIDHDGIGACETKTDRDARLFRDKVKELEMALWRQANKPDGGPIQFRQQATTQIQAALNPGT